VTSIGGGIKEPLQGKLVIFFANAELVRAGQKTKAVRR